MSRRWLQFVVLGASVGLTACSGFYGRAYGGYIQTALSGDVALADTGFAVSTSADIEDDLGLDEDFGSPYVRAELGASIVSVTASAFRYDASGSGTLPVTFGGIPAGVPVTSDIEVLNGKAAVLLNFIDLGPVRLAPGLGVDYFDFDLAVQSQTVPTVFETIDVQAPVPVVYLQGEVDLGPVALTVDGAAMDASVDDIDGTFIDLEGMLRVKPFSHTEIFGGYRWISLDVSGSEDGQDYSGDLRLAGWFVGGGVTF
ncbi:MAG: hypothetical protein AAF628_09100 [Planctomycetota bacterium]